MVLSFWKIEGLTTTVLNSEKGAQNKALAAIVTHW